MIKPRPVAATLLSGLLMLGASACGGSSKHSSTGTTASKGTTSAQGKTSTTGAKAAPKPHKPKSNATPLSQTAPKTLSFSGNGVKDIGKPSPLRIPTDSTIQWTNTGAIFQIIPASVKVQSPVNSKAHNGTAALKKGAYYGFLINAIGDWTVKIVPGG